MIIHFEVSGAQVALGLAIIWGEFKSLLTPITALIKVTIWPALIIYILNGYKSEITKAISRLIEITLPGGIGAKLAQTTQTDESPASYEPQSIELNSTSTTSKKVAEEAITEIASHASATREQLDIVFAVFKKVIDNYPQVTQPDKLKVATYAIAGLQIQLAHEKNYRLLFGSQIKLLRLIRETGKVPVSQARQYYETAKSTFPEYYVQRGYDFDQWFGFLSRTGLMNQNADYLEPPPHTVSFFSYLNAHNLGEGKLL